MAAEDEGAGDGKPAGASGKSRMRRKRPPVTIDLTAEPVAADESAATEAAASTEPSEPEKPEPEKAEGAGEAPEQTQSATQSETESATEPPAESAAEPAPEPEAPEPEPPRTTRPPGASIIGSDDGWARTALAGVAGGIVALILLIVLQAIGLVPSPGRSAALQAADQAKAANDAVAAIDRRLSAVEMITQNLPGKNAVETLNGQVAQLQKEVGALPKQGDLTALQDKLTALSRKVDALPPGATQDELAALAKRVARLEAGGTASGGAPGSAAVASLNDRIDQADARLKTLDGRVAALEGKLSAGPGQSALAARAIAVVALRRAIDEGAPFTSDLDLAAALGLPAADVAQLKPFAEKGVETKAALTAEFAKVGDAIVSATTKANPKAGFFKRLLAGASSLVTVRPTGPVAGNDPAAIVSRMQAAVDKGDFAKALQERDGLPAAGKDASAAWAAAAKSRVTVDALIARIADSIKPAAGNAPT